MSGSHPSRYTGPDFLAHARGILEAAIPGSQALVEGGGGHYTVTVTAEVFRGKKLLEQQRLVLNALGDLLKGDDAPIHAVDRIVIKLP